MNSINIFTLLRKCILCLFLFFSFSGILNNYGNHFIVGFTAQYSGYHYGYIGLSILAPEDTNITILSKKPSAPLNYTTHIGGGEVFEYKLPISLRMSGTGEQMNGVEILSTSNISVVCLNYYSGFVDGYLALPITALGSNYVAASYQPYDQNSRANLAIISANDDNKITVIFGENAIVRYRGILYDKSSSLLYVTLVLEKLEALHISGLSDLSGTIIITSKAVVVLSGVDRAKPFGSVGSYDMLESFLLPVSLWGKDYILTTVRTTDKKKGDIYRIFAYKNNTIVESAYWTRVLSSGKYTELMLDENLASFVTCSEPCQVMQYIRGEKVDGQYADPSMVTLPPVSQFLSYYRVALPYNSQYYDSITIVIRKDYRDGLYINDLKIIGEDWKEINGTKYVWRVFSFSGHSTVTVYHTSSTVKFGLVVFGWNNGLSYAYCGGFAFSNFPKGKTYSDSTLKQYVVVINFITQRYGIFTHGFIRCKKLFHDLFLTNVNQSELRNDFLTSAKTVSSNQREPVFIYQ